MINLADLFGAEAPQIDPVVTSVAEPDLPDQDDDREVDLARIRVAFPFAFGELPDDDDDARDFPDTYFPGALDPADPRSWGPPPLRRLTGLCVPVPAEDRIQEHRHRRIDQPCPRCRSAEYVDIEIHGGRSTRRECSNPHCRRFLGWTRWLGVEATKALESRRVLGKNPIATWRNADRARVSYTTSP